MPKRYCKCPKEHCFDRDMQCESCDPEDLDPEGYPSKARRRLINVGAAAVVDIDTGQEFKVKKVKGGKRLVPQFKGRMDWKSAKGFAAMCLILSCLGAQGEYALWDENASAEMTEKEWRRRNFGAFSKPPVRHRACGDVVTSTSVTSLQSGQGIGCRCHSNHANHWRHRRPEVVAWGAKRGFEVETTEEEWAAECDGNNYRPKLRCVECGEVVTSTSVNSLRQGQGIGCRCHSTMANHWRHRRPEVVAWGERDRFEVETTEEEWAAECDGCNYCPKLRCVECGDPVTSTSITHLQQGHGIGCRCNSTMANHWSHRRPEVVAWGAKRGYEVETTEEEWAAECDGAGYCPKLRCVECGDLVTSTSISHLQQGHGIGCRCKHKTEAKLGAWLRQTFPAATVKTQYRGPETTNTRRQTHFDFHLTFLDGFEVLLELDGPQHFWRGHNFYTDEGCERDLLKERWAVARGLSVVRVLQENVWGDKHGWHGWLTKSVADARTGEARPFTPDALEYRSTNSAYVQLRASS